MLGEVFNQACDYASAAIIATNMAVAEPQVDIDLAEIPPRVEIAGMSLNEPGSIPGVHFDNAEGVSNNFTVDQQVAGLMNPPLESDMQVRYLNEQTFDQSLQYNAPMPT